MIESVRILINNDRGRDSAALSACAALQRGVWYSQQLPLGFGQDLDETLPGSLTHTPIPAPDPPTLSSGSDRTILPSKSCVKPQNAGEIPPLTSGKRLET